jgi:hypothetical protein
MESGVEYGELEFDGDGTNEEFREILASPAPSKL